MQALERTIKAGDGWRLGWHSSQPKYPGLVGSDDWAIELTQAEFRDFYRLLNQLVETMQAVEAELMDEERINCEAETELLWLEVEGYPHSYSLRLILNGDRRCEGNWAEGSAPQLLTAIKSIDLS